MNEVKAEGYKVDIYVYLCIYSSEQVSIYIYTQVIYKWLCKLQLCVRKKVTVGNCLTGGILVPLNHSFNQNVALLNQNATHVLLWQRRVIRMHEDWKTFEGGV